MKLVLLTVLVTSRLLGTVEESNSCLCSVGKLEVTPRLREGRGKGGGQETGHGNGERLRLRVECWSVREGRGKGGGQETGHGNGERLRLRVECWSVREGREVARRRYMVKERLCVSLWLRLTCLAAGTERKRRGDAWRL